MVIILLLCCLAISQVLAISPRVLQGCITLDTKVYCYGGYLSALNGRFVNATSDIYTSDLSLPNFRNPWPSLDWSLVKVSSSTNSSTLEPRAAMAITSLNETHCLISGGESDGNNTLNNSTIIFDSRKKTAVALSAPPFSTYAGSLVATDSKTVWGYGGQLINSSDPAPNTVLKLNLSTFPATWSTLAASSFAPKSSRYGHAVVLKNTMIYYFGGFFPPGEGVPYSRPIQFETVDFYNTASDQWGTIMASGATFNITPTSRKYHTATLVDDDSVLIYGGASVDRPQSLPVLDYSYIFSLKNHTYKKINLDITSAGAGPRSGHSAVLYEKTVFIIFGYDSSGNLQNDAHLLDVTDSAQPIWSNSDGYDPNSSGVPEASGANNTTAIVIGAVVGGVGLILLIIGGIIYYCRKKKAQRAAVLYQHCLPSSPQNHSTELASISPPTPPPLPNHGHNYYYNNNRNNNSGNNDNIRGGSAVNMATNNNQPPEYPLEPAPRYSLHPPQETQTSKANPYTSR